MEQRSIGLLVAVFGLDINRLAVEPIAVWTTVIRGVSTRLQYPIRVGWLERLQNL